MSEGLTIDKLNAMIASLGNIPPMPFFASSKLFPPEQAMKFTHKGRDHFGAHPDFWKKLPPSHSLPDFAGIPIINLDIDYGRKVEFFNAMADVITSAA